MRRTTQDPPGGTDDSFCSGPGLDDVRRAGDRGAVRAGARVAEQRDEVALEAVADGVLEPAGLLVHLRPRDLQHVDEQHLGQPVLAQHRGGVRPAVSVRCSTRSSSSVR
jgi:hypothetical protein